MWWLEKLKAAFQERRCSMCFIEMSRGKILCPPCQKRLPIRPPTPLWKKGLSQIYAATPLSPVVKPLLYGHKFYGRQNTIRPLLGILTYYWQTLKHVHLILPHETIWVTAIPSRSDSPNPWKKVVQKFCHQHSELTWAPLLRWNRMTQPQHLLESREARWKNLENSMSIREDLFSQLLRKKNAKLPDYILILDDLTTTGMTLKEALQAFERSREFQKYETPIPRIGLALSKVPFQESRLTLRSHPTPTPHSPSSALVLPSNQPSLIGDYKP